MAEHLLGLHEGCGGPVYEADQKMGGRLCNLCGASGVEALLMSEIFMGDDLTPTVLVPDDSATEVDSDEAVDIDVEEFSDEIPIKVGAKRS